VRVLVVDDNKDITEMVSFYLEMQGIQCSVVNDALKGLEKIRSEEEFDVILLDLAMPEFSGYNIINSLKQENLLKSKNIVLFTAASISDKEIAELFSVGAKGVLKKPPSIDELVETIKKFRK
jgi:two-component system OmpR family response regulator